MPDITCPVCHSVNASTRTFCWKCAADLHAVVPDPNAPPPPPKLEVPLRPLLIGGGVALAAIALIAVLVVLLSGGPASTSSPSEGPASGASAATQSARASGAGERPGSVATATPVTAAPATEAPAPTQAPPATPKITAVPAPAILSFTGPRTVDCDDAAFNGFITLTWAVADAEGTTISIDGPGLYERYPGTRGSAQLPFGCGAGEHRYTLTTVGGEGPAASKTLTITEG